MKKILFIIALAAASFTVSAQNKGDMSVGGILGVSGGGANVTTSFSGNSTTVKSPGTTSLEFSPEFNYFVIDRLELSAGLNYTMTREQISTTSDGANLFQTTNVAMFAIGANYFIPLFGSNFYYTPGLRLGFGGGSVASQTSLNSKSTMKIPFVFSTDLEFATFEFKPVDFLGISFTLLDVSIACYNMDTGSDNVKMSSTSYRAGLNYGTSIGVKYYF